MFFRIGEIKISSKEEETFLERYEEALKLVFG